MLRLEPLSTANFHDFEALTACGDDGNVCYCSFWHIKVASMAEYAAMKEKEPLALRELIRSKVKGGFHVGALAYDDSGLAAWISVAPVAETYWCWKRVAALGAPLASTTAGITCLTLAPNARGKGLQREVAKALLPYGRALGWGAIEAYPFDDAVLAVAGNSLAWPGFEKPYVDAGFRRVSEHWLSAVGRERWICSASLG